MSSLEPLDVLAKERIADRERMAGPLRVAAEARRERLGWRRETRMTSVAAAVGSVASKTVGLVVGVGRVARSAVFRVGPRRRVVPEAPVAAAETTAVHKPL